MGLLELGAHRCPGHSRVPIGEASSAASCEPQRVIRGQKMCTLASPRRLNRAISQTAACALDARSELDCVCDPHPGERCNLIAKACSYLLEKLWFPGSTCPRAAASLASMFGVGA